LLNKIYTKMSGHPTCDVVLNFNPNRKHFSAGDDLRGRICIKTAVEGQNISHQGIKVSLLGMILQALPHTSRHQTNQAGMIKDYKASKSEITAQNIQHFRQYTFMQIQKEAEKPGEFQDFKEIEFEFLKLEDELKEHESYDGIDNFIKYFIKINMTYQGGSLVAGKELERLHEIKVKNHYALRGLRKRVEEIKNNQELGGAEQAMADGGASNLQTSAGSQNIDSESIALDQTFDQASRYGMLEGESSQQNHNPDAYQGAHDTIYDSSNAQQPAPGRSADQASFNTYGSQFNLQSNQGYDPYSQ
jgi:hypothetical protein